jgi:AraC-like DNA-binding protein
VEPWGALTILVVVSGAVSIAGERGTEILPRDTIAIRPDGFDSPLAATPSGAKVVVLQYDAQVLRMLGQFARFQQRPATFRGRASVEMSWRLAGELRAPDPLTPVSIGVVSRGILLATTRYHLHNQRRVHPRVTAARRILDQRVADPPTTEALAAEVGCTPEHLTRLFRANLGYTVRGWVTRRRLERARQLLVGTTLPIGVVALRLGFADTPHFARTFRRHTGVSPGEFRSLQGRINPVPKPPR